MKLAETGLDTEQLQDATLVAFSPFLVVSYNNKEVKVTPKLEDALNYLARAFWVFLNFFSGTRAIVLAPRCGQYCEPSGIILVHCLQVTIGTSMRTTYSLTSMMCADG
jgi:hypothetical protein